MSSENLSMAWNTFEGDVPPLKTQVSPNSGALKIRPSNQRVTPATPAEAFVDESHAAWLQSA